MNALGTTVYEDIVEKYLTLTEQIYMRCCRGKNYIPRYVFQTFKVNKCGKMAELNKKSTLLLIPAHF